MKPYVAHVIECFGFDRVMYGSDWTVSELTHRYPDWVEILDEVVAGATPDELKKNVSRELSTDLSARRLMGCATGRLARRHSSQ